MSGLEKVKEKTELRLRQDFSEDYKVPVTIRFMLYELSKIIWVKPSRSQVSGQDLGDEPAKESRERSIITCRWCACADGAHEQMKRVRRWSACAVGARAQLERMRR